MYSDAQDLGFNTLGQQFLRGYQVSDADGMVRFTTIYPGWYRGRAVHIHFKIRGDAGSGQSYEFTSQFFFDEALTDRVFARAPYASRVRRDTTNADDGIYREAGPQLVLAVAEAGPGYRALFNLGLDLSDAETGRLDRGRGPGGPGGPPGDRPPGGPPRRRGGRPVG